MTEKASPGWVWAFQLSTSFGCRSENFANWSAFREWAFDPEFGFERKQRVYVETQSFEVPLFWPHAAIRLLGLDIAIGFCIRAPLSRYADMHIKSHGKV